MDRFLDVAQLSHSGKSGVRRDRRAGYRLLPHSRRLYMAYHGMERTRDCDSPAYLGKKARKEDGIYSCHPIYIMAGRITIIISPGKVSMRERLFEKNSAGEEVRPMDFSLTKNVCGLFLSCGLLLFIVLRTAIGIKAPERGAGRIYRIDGNGHLLHTRRGDQRGDRKRI